jgi:tRNA threonylcarbamoyladenosine biosynthesis protein TsaE
LRESQFPAPGLNLSSELNSIETSAHGTPIVGTPSDKGALWHGRWDNEAATEAFARRLAACPAIAHATITLTGDLGAGKTTFARHLLRALGVVGRIKSPTYAVVEPHRAEAGPQGPLNAWHFDFYRFSDPREWEDAGFRDMMASPGLKLVEWPERAPGLTGAIDAALTLAPDPRTPPGDDGEAADEPRLVSLQAFTHTGRCLLEALQ